MVDAGSGTFDPSLAAEPDPASPEVGRLRGRMSLSIADQGVAAGCNFLVTVVAARSLDTVGFGVFGLLYVVYLLVLGATRALAGEPALVRSSAPGWQLATVRSALLLSLGAAAAVGAVALAVGGDHRSAGLLLAALLPGLVLQDVGRYVGFAASRPGRALRLDVIWGVVQVAALGGLAVTGRLTTLSLLLAWGAAGGVSAIAFLVLDLRRLPVPSVAWLRDSWEFSWRYLTAFATTAGIVYLAAMLLGSISGVSAVGTVRGTQVVFGPLNVVYAGIVAVLVPEGARSGQSPEEFRRRLIIVSSSLAGVAALVTLVALLAPDRAGRALLGDTWPSARAVLPAAGLVAVMGSAVAGAEIGLRAARAVRESLRVQLTLAPVELVVPVVGALIAGVAGFMWASAAATTLAAHVWWRAFSARAREQQAAAR